mmetsp:Transcript_7014/g.12944  ORF Transcript_7014/g.12944 Transcript_7014/m.12944 type:complete len:203 (+) Transcript_7014:238-846(+)
MYVRLRSKLIIHLNLVNLSIVADHHLGLCLKFGKHNVDLGSGELFDVVDCLLDLCDWRARLASRSEVARDRSSESLESFLRYPEFLPLFLTLCLTSPAHSLRAATSTRRARSLFVFLLLVTAYDNRPLVLPFRNLFVYIHIVLGLPIFVPVISVFDFVLIAVVVIVVIVVILVALDLILAVFFVFIPVLVGSAVMDREFQQF